MRDKRRLKNKWLWLIACKRLLAYYQREPTDYDGEACELCMVAGAAAKNDDNLNNCADCVWLYFENKNCCEFTLSQGLSGFDRHKRSKAWVKLRIPMLKRWVRKLTKEIKNEKA